MSHQIDIYYDDGRIDCFPDTAFSSVFGESVLDDISFRFDADILKVGLIAELRHFEASFPEQDDFAYEPDPRGYSCQGKADAWPVLIDAEEAKHVIAIRYNDRLIVKRMGDALVNMAHLNELAMLYFNDEATLDTYMKIAALYHLFADKRRKALADSIDEPLSAEAERLLIASQIGVSLALLDDALDYEAYLNSTSADDGEGAPSADARPLDAPEYEYVEDDEQW